LSIIERHFLRHPREQGESYGQHARFAASVGLQMIAGGLACLVHSILPSLFTTAGSRTIRSLSARIAGRGPPAPARSDGTAVSSRSAPAPRLAPHR
jgi:hypothetical protein